MYHHVSGDLVELSPTRAVVEAAGVGYECTISFSTYSSLKADALKADQEAGRPVRVLTHLWVREDQFRLFGFATAAERELFRTVISVNGLGPANAMTLLSSVSADEFREILVDGDPGPLLRIKGIGKKLANRIVVELRDQIQEGRADSPALPKRRSLPATRPDSATEASLALEELGFTRREATERVESAVSRLSSALGPEQGSRVTEFSVEAILHQALRLG